MQKLSTDSCDVLVSLAPFVFPSNISRITPGLYLRYHKHKDFVKLPKEQKDELNAWQKENAGKPSAENK